MTRQDWTRGDLGQRGQRALFTLDDDRPRPWHRNAETGEVWQEPGLFDETATCTDEVER